MKSFAPAMGLTLPACGEREKRRPKYDCTAHAGSRSHTPPCQCDCPGFVPHCSRAISIYIEGGNLKSCAPMIYLLAIFVPPLGLLLNGQPLAAFLNVALIVPCLMLGLFFPVLLLIPSLHAVITVYMKREQRRHREIVDAIERHGPPPGWRR